MELLLCRHHYRTCFEALPSFGVALYDHAGRLVAPGATPSVILHEAASR